MGLTREYANRILNRVKDDPGSYSVEVVTRALVATGDITKERHESFSCVRVQRQGETGIQDEGA